MFLKTIDKSIYKKNTFDNLEKYKELWFINNGFISQDKIIDIFYDAYSDREIRFDTLDKFFSNNRQLLLKYLPELHIQLKTIASNELTDLLKNAGLKIVNKNETKQKTKQDSKSKSKESSKSKGDAKSNQSTTPGNFSTNTNEFMNQVFSKNESSGDGNVERESDNLLLVDNDNNSVNETIQKSLIDTIMKITIMKSHSIILEWINHFDILFSNFDYSVGGSINDWINVSQYQKLLEQIDNINKNAEAEAAKIATKWVQEHYSEIAKFVPRGKDGRPPTMSEVYNVVRRVWDLEKDDLKGEKGDTGDISKFVNYDDENERNKWVKQDSRPIDFKNSVLLSIRTAPDDTPNETEQDEYQAVNKWYLNNRLKKVGDTSWDYKNNKWLGGNIDFNNRRLQNIETPYANFDAATKAYVDNTIREGGFWDGIWNNFRDPNINGKRIINVGQPILPDDVATKLYVDDKTFFSLVDRRGKKYYAWKGKENIDTGKYRIGTQDPLVDRDVATKYYVDKNNPFEWSDSGRELRYKWKEPIGFNQQNLSEVKDPIANDDAATRNFVLLWVRMMFSELGYTKDQVAQAEAKVENFYQSTLKKENESDEPKE